jgi:hypothetical protein
VGKVVLPLQSVNCHDCHAHGHERHGPFTRLVGLWWFEFGWVTRSSWFGSWYATGVKPVCMFLRLATGGMPVSSVGFGYRWDTYKRWSVLATGVTPICLWPLVIEG